MRKLFVQIKEKYGVRSAATAGTVFPLVIGLACYMVTDRWIERDARQRFAAQALSARTSLENKVKSYSDLLRSVGSFIRANPTVTPDAFRIYVDGLNLKVQFPGVWTVNYAEHVLPPDLPSLEQRLTDAYGHPSPPRKGTWVYPPGARSEYDIITLVQPPRLMGSPGVDVGANDGRREMVDRIRDSGEMLQSPEPFRGKYVSPDDPVFGVRLPLYRARMPTANPEQRRAAFFGTAGISFGPRTLVQGVLADMPMRKVRMTLVDVSPGPQSEQLPRVPGGRLILDTGPGHPTAVPPDPDEYFSATEAIQFYNRRWNVTFSVPKRCFYTGSEMYFSMLAAGAGAITAFLLYALFHAMSCSRRRALALAGAMTLDLRRLSARADQVRENERQRIAREIHDDLGQNLLALRIEADILTERTRQGHPRLHARAALTRDQIDTTIKSVRQIINDLRPAVLDLGLAAALEWQVAEFSRRSGIKCMLAGHTGIELDDRRATAFFRILQESLSNIMRHAHASAVQVEVHAAPGEVEMTITDNGIGLPAGAGSGHGSFGLLGIEERVTMLAGTFSLQGAPGQGTRISVSIPLPGDAAPPFVAQRQGQDGPARDAAIA